MFSPVRIIEVEVLSLNIYQKRFGSSKVGMLLFGSIQNFGYHKQTEQQNRYKRGKNYPRNQERYSTLK